LIDDKNDGIELKHREKSSKQQTFHGI